MRGSMSRRDAYEKGALSLRGSGGRARARSVGVEWELSGRVKECEGHRATPTPTPTTRSPATPTQTRISSLVRIPLSHTHLASLLDPPTHLASLPRHDDPLNKD